MEALTDHRVMKLLKKALYRQPLIEKIDLMSANIDALTKQINDKDTRIRDLKKKVCTLEQLAEKNEQYTRRSNLVFRGFKETGKDEDTDAKMMALVNKQRHENRTSSDPSRHRTQPSTRKDTIERELETGPSLFVSTPTAYVTPYTELEST